MRRLAAALLVVLAAACGSGHASVRQVDESVTRTSETATTTTLPPLPAAPASGEVRALRTRNGVIVPVVQDLGGGAYKVESPCSRTLTVKGGTPLYGATVVLDPGHGGKETGAGGASGAVERDLNLTVAKLAQAGLEAAGATVVLTHERDYEMTLQARADVALRLKPLAFISIHHNGGADGPSDKPGTETYYQYRSPDSKRLAGLLYEEVFAAFAGRPGVQWFANVDAGAKYRLGDSGNDYYGVLRYAAGVPSAIDEALFISASPTEAALLARPDVQQAEAAAITRAVQRYAGTKDPGSGFVTPIPRTTPAGPGGAPEGCVDTPLG